MNKQQRDKQRVWWLSVVTLSTIQTCRMVKRRQTQPFARVWENANFETENKARCFTSRRSHAQKERLLSWASGRAVPCRAGSPSRSNGTLFDAIQMAWPAWCRAAPRSVANKAHCLRTAGCQSFLGAWSRPLTVCWHAVGVAERQVRGRCFEERVSLRGRV